MPVDPESINTIQLPLFDFQKASAYSFELFPRVWGASEALVDNKIENRLAGLDTLEELNAARFSPLISYLLFTRLVEPDLALRVRIIKILSGVLSPDDEGRNAPENVRQIILHYLSTLKLKDIYGLLEAAEYDQTLEPKIATLLKSDWLAGDYLLEILLDRKMPLGIRKQAANFIARVGFVNAAQGLERFIYRLESKINGQQLFALNNGDSLDESQLLPIVKDVLAILQAP